MRTQSKKTKDQTPALVMENIHKHFGSLEVLKGIDLTANKGDIISLIGSSGSGKSTCLRCMNLLEVPDQGELYVNGEHIQLKLNRQGQMVPQYRKQVERIRASLGMVFQNFNLWTHMTILENIIEAPVHVLGIPKHEAIEKADALLEKVGLYDKKYAYPNHLSGGQKQRAAIARALAMNPSAILFDEPTSALDPEMVGEVLSVMQTLAEDGITMMIVTHEMAFARDISSKIVFLHDGKVLEEGTPKQIFESPKTKRCQQFLASQNR